MSSSKSGRRAGRPEKPLSDDSAAAVARALRELREACGAPTYPSLERGADGVSARRLAEAARGDRLPPWKHVRAYVYACWEYAATRGHNIAGHGEIGPWEQLYRAAGGNLDGAAEPALRLLPTAPQSPLASEPPPASKPSAARQPLRATYPPISPPPRPIRGPKRAWPKLVLGLLTLVVVLASPSSSASRPVTVPRTAWCAYVTAMPALVLSAPSADAAIVKGKDLGNGIEILPLPHPPGWWPVYTPFNSPDHNWMPASVLSALVAGTRPCPDKAVATVMKYNYDSAQEQFAIGSDCSVYHRWQTQTGQFSRWSKLGGCASSHQELAVGMNADGELVAFVISPDHTVRYIFQSRPGLGPWVGWIKIGGDVSTGLHVVSASKGSSPMEVFARDKSGNLWEDNQTQGNCCWSGWRKVQ